MFGPMVNTSEAFADNVSIKQESLILYLYVVNLKVPNAAESLILFNVNKMEESQMTYESTQFYFKETFALASSILKTP